MSAAVLVVCAWCGKTLREPPPGSGEPVTSHGLCAGCAAGSGVFAVEDLHGLSPADLDELPVGAVELDPDGVVLSYNAAEERLTGFDRARVIGRNFFVDVAPCARVEEFHGRYLELVTTGAPGPAQLKFVFRLPGLERFVNIRLTYDAARRRGFVLVQSQA